MHGRSGFSEPATRLVGDEPERGEVLVLGGLGLDPNRVPGELLEVKHLALGKCSHMTLRSGELRCSPKSSQNACDFYGEGSVKQKSYVPVPCPCP